MPFDKRLPQAHRPANSAEELMALPDEDFIYCAYWTMLGRSADPDGFGHFRGKVRAGLSKADILLLLSRSSEGKVHNVYLPEVRELVRRQGLARHPWLGFFYRRHFKIAKDDAAARQLNMLENRVMAIAAETSMHLAHLEALIAKKSHGAAPAPQQQKRIVNPVAVHRATSRRVGEIFSQLSATISHEDVEAA